MLKALALFAASASTLLAMHVAEFNINEKDIEAGLHFDLGQFNETVDPDTTFVGIRYIHASDDHSDASKVDDMVQGIFLMRRPVAGGFTFGMGIKALRTQIHGYGFSAIPLGFEAGYRIPGNTLIPMELGATFYYSPQVLSFEDAQNYIEWRVHYDLELIPRGKLSLGYRSIDTNYEAGDVEYNHAGYLGFKFAF